jgi:hypothetical protein
VLFLNVPHEPMLFPALTFPMPDLDGANQGGSAEDDCAEECEGVHGAGADHDFLRQRPQPTMPITAKTTTTMIRPANTVSAIIAATT